MDERFKYYRPERCGQETVLVCNKIEEITGGSTQLDPLRNLVMVMIDNT